MSYYVLMVDDDPIPVYGPYSLKSAKDFARIGSQHGASRRVVTRGKGMRSVPVRVYWKGVRLWPAGDAEIEISGLRAGELPRVPEPYVKKSMRGPFAVARERLAQQGLPLPGGR